MKAAAVLTACLVAAVAAQGPPQNMNRLQYTISNGLPGKDVRGFEGQYFEVYSPVIRSQYSQVVWKALDSVALPDSIVKQYDNKVMAVTGFEVDVVRRNNGTDTSVPCYESYNHHFTMHMYGKGVNLVKNEVGPDAHGNSFGHKDRVIFARDPNAVFAFNPDVIPGVQAFNEHNGNEARQSYHGLPPKMVQPIQSPQRFVFNPMQINTKNPDGSGKRGGPLPRSSQAPPNASYSGILECPCTTRTVKKIDGFDVVPQGTCPPQNKLAHPSDCFAAALQAGISPVVNNVTENSATDPAGCFIRASASAAKGGKAAFEVVFNQNRDTQAPCSSPSGTADVPLVHGHIQSLVDVTLDLTNGSATITLAGPANKWFAVGFDATTMADQPWTIVVEAVDGAAAVSERALGNHAPGNPVATQVKVLSNTVVGNTRTVVLTRPLKGMDAQHYTFSMAQGGTPFGIINAIGATPKWDNHMHDKATSATIQLLAVPGGTSCLCAGTTGTINGRPFNPRCMDEPLSDLLKQHNPTCYLSTYRGGLACCTDNTFLLDADQEIPAPVDEVYYKWRFYYRDFNPSEDTPLIHLEWQFGHIEYDVPQAKPGTPPQEAVHELTTRFTLKDFMDLYGKPGCDPFTEPYCADTNKVTKAGVDLIMAGAHCHSPACLSVELYNEDTGEMLCRVQSVPGTGDDAMNELGYLWLPPCQWGSAEDGLATPPRLQLDTNLTSIKRVNSTYGHTGVMAIWQARGKYNV